MDDIGVLLEVLNNCSERGANIHFTIPCVNNLFEEIDNYFLRFGDRIQVFLISPDLFELIKPNVEYYPEIKYYYDKGRRYSLFGKYHGGRIIVDTSLTNHNFGWIIITEVMSNIFTPPIKHKLIIS